MSNKLLSLKRSNRVRTKIKKVNKNKVRLTVFKSNKNIYAQIIDDKKGIVLTSASTLENGMQQGKNINSAKLIGNSIGQRAIKLGIDSVVCDRGRYKYHGTIKALFESVREVGIKC